MSKLMDLRELAAYLRLDRQTLYNWLHQRKLSGIKMGGVWRFDRQTIDRWLQQQTIQAAPTHTPTRTTAAHRIPTAAMISPPTQSTDRPGRSRAARTGASGPRGALTPTLRMAHPVSVMERPT